MWLEDASMIRVSCRECSMFYHGFGSEIMFFQVMNNYAFCHFNAMIDGYHLFVCFVVKSHQQHVEVNF